MQNAADMIVYDTETTGLPQKGLPFDDPKQVFPVQIGYVLTTAKFEQLTERVLLIRPPKGVYMHPRAEAVHGKSIDYLNKVGMPLDEALAIFREDCAQCVVRAAYNIEFDDRVMQYAQQRLTGSTYEQAAVEIFGETEPHCVMNQATAYLRVPQDNGGYRRLKLSQVYRRIVGRHMMDAHDALGDVRGTLTVFKAMTETTPIIVDPTV